MYVYAEQPPNINKMFPANTSEIIGNVMIPAKRFTEMTTEELAAIHVYPLVEDLQPAISKYQFIQESVTWDAQVFVFRKSFTVQDRPVEEIPAIEVDDKAQWKDAIDRAAGNVREHYAAYPLIAEEYMRTYELTKEFVAAGYPQNSIPAVVQSWADASGMSVNAAADNIIQTGNQYNAILDMVRDIRLKGKAAVMQASLGQIEVAGRECVATLEALIQS